MYGRFETSSVAPTRRGLNGRTSALPLSVRKWRQGQLPLGGRGERGEGGGGGEGIKLGLLLNDDDDRNEQNGADNRSRGTTEPQQQVRFFSIYADFSTLIISIESSLQNVSLIFDHQTRSYSCTYIEIGPLNDTISRIEIDH